MEIVAHIDFVSYYQFDGWAWCPADSSIIVRVFLVNSAGKTVAVTNANTYREDLKSAQIGDGQYSFSFKGHLKNISQIVFRAGEDELCIPVSYTQPDDAEFSLIHVDDYLLKFLLTGYDYNSVEDAIEYYFLDGRDSADKLKKICTEYLNKKEGLITLLEFASGYGRVTRHLDFSLFDVTASDIHEDAIAFLESQFNLKTLLSKTKANEFFSSSRYDVVFALSFFSHIPRSAFGDWIAALWNCVNENGILIFTTHGRISNRQIKMPLEYGFGFQPHSDQGDLSTADYGTTVSELPHVTRTLIEKTGCPPSVFIEKFWWNHQDLYIVRKEI